MFLIFPFLVFSGLLSILTLVFLTSLYGLGLVLLALMIRNVRQETARESLLKFTYVVAVDHLLAAVTGIACGILLVSIPDLRNWVPLLHDQDRGDSTMAVVLFTVIAFFTVVWILVGIFLLTMAPDLAARISVYRQARWEPWLVALTCLGLFLNLSTGLIFLVILAPVLWHVVHVARMSRQSSLVWTLTIAVRQGLPLGPEIDSLADGLWGRQRLRLKLLSENLDAGLSLATALERQPGLVPRSVVMMIRMGEETEMLVPALETCAAGYTRRHDHEFDLMSAQHGFLLLLIPLTFIPLILGFLSYNIVPKFKKIFLDFDTELPSITVNALRILDESGGYFVYMLAVSCVAALMVYLNVKDWERDWPLLNLLGPRINGPPILRSVALLIRQRRSLESGIQALIWSHPRPSARRRLTEVHRQLLQGRDLAGALADNKLIRRGDAPLLRAAERVQNLPWSLEQLAESMEQTFWYRIRLLLEVGNPLVVLLIGIVVGLAALAFFMPLVKILNDLPIEK